MKPRNQHLAGRAARASIYSVVGQIAQFAVGIASVGMLAALVAPADYGLVAMASVLTGVLGVLGDSGVQAALIQRATVDDATEATAFWVVAAGSLGLAVMCAAGAPILGALFSDRRVTDLALAYAAGFVLAAPSRVPIALLQRELRFGVTSTITLLSSVVGLGAGITVALRGGGAWSLVSQTLATFAFQSIAASWVRRYSIRLTGFSRAKARELARFGSNLSGFSFANTVARLLDSVLGGKWVGASGLGMFGMAMRLFVVPLGRLCVVISNVFLPTMAAAQDDTTRARAFSNLVRVTAMVTFPISVGAAAIAPEIESFLPPRWAGVSGPLRVLAAGSVADALTWYSIALLIAFGRVRALLVLGVVLVPISWGAIALGSMTGAPTGMAAGWVAWNAGMAVGLLYLVSRDIPLDRKFWAGLLRTLAAAVAMGAVVRAVVHFSGTSRAPSGALVGVATGTIVYTGIVWTGMRADAARILSLLRAGVTGPPKSGAVV